MSANDLDKANSISILRSSHRRCSVTKDVLRNFAKFAEKYLWWSLFFKKVAVLSPPTLLKKRFWHMSFPVNFAKFLRTSFSQNTSGRLLLHLVLFCRNPLPQTIIFSVRFFSNLFALFSFLFVRLLCLMYPPAFYNIP